MKKKKKRALTLKNDYTHMKFSGKNGWLDALDTKKIIFIIPWISITDQG